MRAKNILNTFKHTRSDDLLFLLQSCRLINCSMKLQPWVVWLCVNSFPNQQRLSVNTNLSDQKHSYILTLVEKASACQWRASRNNATRHTHLKLIIDKNIILRDEELAVSLGGDLIIIQLLLPFLCKFYKMARVPNLRSGPARRTSDMTNRFRRSHRTTVLAFIRFNTTRRRIRSIIKRIDCTRVD